MDIRRWVDKKPNRHLTIKVITDTGATTRNYVLSLQTVRLAKIGLIAVAFVFVLGIVAMVDSLLSRRTIARLEITTEQLRHQSQLTSELREQLAEIWVINERLHRMLGGGTTFRDKRPMYRPLPWGVPIAQWVGRPFRLRPTEQAEQGIYLYANAGALVMATAAGTVADIRWNPTNGDVLIIDHGNGLQTRYAHDLTTFVRPGEFVMQGQTIGVIRPTADSRRPMLYYQVVADGESVNPLLSMLGDISASSQASGARRDTGEFGTFTER